MSFANPWALWLGAAAAPLIVAFLIRRWRRQRTVSSVVIFRLLAAQTATRRRFATPHHLVALLLSLLALAALVLAAARPEGAHVDPMRYVVVFDNSASMSATELGFDLSRHGRAVTELSGFVSELDEADETALVTMGAEARLAVGWTHDHSRLLEAATDLEPLGSGSASLEAFRVANAMCTGRTDTEIVLVSDGAGLAIPPLDCPLRYARIGAPASNVAITGFTVREADALGLHEIYLALHNASDYTREVRVELELDGVLVDVSDEGVPPYTTVERLTRMPLPDGEVLTARLSVDGENALTQDDVGYAVLRPGARVQTLLLTEHPTTFMAEALRLHPHVDLTVTSPSAIDPSAGPYDLLVMDASYDGPLPRAEHLVVLDAGQAMLGLETSGRIADPEIIRWSFDHPLFRFVNLDGVHIASATATHLPPGATSLMDMPDGPLIFALEDGGLEILYFTFHPDRSDLPLRVAFVNLVANLVEWAQPIDPQQLRASLGAGERLSAEVPGLSLERLTSSGVTGPRLDAREPLPRSGVYRVISGEGTTRGLVAANLFSVEESDLTPRSRLGVGAIHGWPEVTHAEPFPWWLLALAAIGMLLLEWILPGLVGLTYRFRRFRAQWQRRRAAEAGESASPRTEVAGV